MSELRDQTVKGIVTLFKENGNYNGSFDKNPSTFSDNPVETFVQYTPSNIQKYQTELGKVELSVVVYEQHGHVFVHFDEVEAKNASVEYLRKVVDVADMLEDLLLEREFDPVVDEGRVSKKFHFRKAIKYRE